MGPLSHPESAHTPAKERKSFVRRAMRRRKLARSSAARTASRSLTSCGECRQDLEPELRYRRMAEARAKEGYAAKSSRASTNAADVAPGDRRVRAAHRGGPRSARVSRA